MAWLAVVFTLLALLTAAVAEAAARGRLARGYLVGIRFPATLRSDAAWVAGHSAATTPAWIGTAVTAALTITSFFVGESASTSLGLLTLGALIATLAAASVSAIRAAEAVGTMKDADAG